MKRETKLAAPDANQNHQYCLPRQLAKGEALNASSESSTHAAGKASLLKLIFATACLAAFALPAYAQTEFRADQANAIWGAAQTPERIPSAFERIRLQNHQLRQK